MNEHELGDAFESILPEQPSAKGWADEARRRRRRNRAVTGAAAIVLAAAVAIPVGLSLGNSDDGLVATPNSSPTPPFDSPTSLVPDICRDADGYLPSVTDLPDGGIPDGATRVWLCGGPSFSEVEFVGAPEPLVIGVDEAIAAFNSVPTELGTFDCPANVDVGYTVVHEYPDGSRQVVAGSLGGCEAVVGVMHFRYEPAAYLESLQELWSEQRTQLGSTFTFQGNDCSSPVSVMGVGLADMTRGHVCAPKTAYDEPDNSSVRITLSDGLVADMAVEAADASVPMDAEVDISPGTPSVILSSPTGDPLTLRGLPWAYTWHDPTTNRLNEWRPGTDMAERIWSELTAGDNCARTADDYLRCTTDESAEPTMSPPSSDTVDDEYRREVARISYQQEALVAAHPDVFLGFELPDDGQTAIILCKSSERARCDELVATLELPADAPVETKEVGNSLLDIKTKRVAVLQAAEDLGVAAVDALADRFQDGIVLEVTAQAFTEDGTLAPAGSKEKLTKLGMVEVRLVLPPPPETSIAGIPILAEPDWSGSTIQDTNAEMILFDELNGVINRHPDIFGGAAISRHRDQVIIYAKSDRMAQAREILAASGVDETYWRVMPVDMSLSEVETAMPAFIELVDGLGLQVASAGPEMEAGGIVMEMVDLQQLTTLAPGDLARLKDAGVVGVREGQIAIAIDTPADLPTADVEPSPIETTS